jgi:uncharacterized protein YndB with AHSA1/START domain
MTTTRTDRGSTESTTIFSENGDLTYERVFAASREKVWRANTERDLVDRHQTRVEQLDVRPGGEWNFVSTDTDGNEFVFYGEFLEIVEPERIKWTFMFDVPEVGPQGGPETITFEELGDGRTLMRAVSHMGSEEAVEAALPVGMIDGAIETWDRLDALLAEI